MTPTPEVDPRQRPLHLAIRSTRLLGFCSTLFGLVIVFALGYFNRYRAYRVAFIALGLVVWVVPGVLLMTYAMLLTQRRRRAAIGALAVASAHGLFALAAFVASVTLPPVSPIPILLSVLWLAAVGQIIVYLWRSLPLLEHDAQRRHGFEISATPRSVLPVEERK